MAHGSYETTWREYEDVAKSLYQRPAGNGLLSDRGEAVIQSAAIDERGRVLLEKSEQLREILTDAMRLEDAELRELAGLKLIAAATYDVSIAADILQAGNTMPAAERSGRMMVLSAGELMEVLDTPLEGKMKALIKGEFERSGLPNTPEAARAELRRAVDQFLKDVPEQATSLAKSGVMGAVNFGLGPAQGILSLVSHEVRPGQIGGRRATKVLVPGFR